MVLNVFSWPADLVRRCLGSYFLGEYTVRVDIFREEEEVNFSKASEARTRTELD